MNKILFSNKIVYVTIVIKWIFDILFGNEIKDKLAIIL